MRLGFIWILGIALSCVAFATDEIDEEIRKSDESSQRLLMQDCIKAFRVWDKYKVSGKEEEELDTFGLLAIQGAVDLNPYEIRSSVYAMGKHSMFDQAVRSPRWLIVLKRLLDFAENDSFSLEPFNQDVRLSYERFLKHQLLMKQLDPLFDNALACQAIEDASKYFYSKSAMGLFDLMSEYDSKFFCHLPLRPLNTPLNGTFLRDPEDFRKGK